MIDIFIQPHFGIFKSSFMIFNIYCVSTWGEGGRAVAGAGVGAGLGPGSRDSVATTTVSAAAGWHGAMPALNLRLTPPAPEPCITHLAGITYLFHREILSK